MLLLVLHGLVDDVGGPEGPVGVGGLAGGGLGGGAEVSGAVSFLFILLYFIFFLLSGLLTDGVPPDSGLGAGLWLRLPGDVVGGGVLDPPLLLEGLAGGVEACWVCGVGERLVVQVGGDVPLHFRDWCEGGAVPT